MKKVYSFRDGLHLTSVPANIVNIDKKTKAADVVDPSGKVTLVTGVPYSEKPADGHWSEIDDTPPAPPAPDDRDARIAELEARLADAEAKAAKADKKG